MVEGDRPSRLVASLGGRDNLRSIDACTTRLRLVVRDQDAVDETLLRQLGARGLIRPSAHDLQFVIGPTADQLARDMKAVAAVAPMPAVDAIILTDEFGRAA